jgi:mannose-6-phosphate isomerase-like protein (cupin superfamily)
MSSTTLLVKRNEMTRKPLNECHGGQGALDWVSVLGGEQLKGRHLRFMHDDVLPPGVSIGVHGHKDNEEYYYIVSGKGVMTLDGKEFEVGPGDVTAVFAGGSHGLENRGDEDLRIIVVCVA